jgi:hypothetical protein
VGPHRIFDLKIVSHTSPRRDAIRTVLFILNFSQCRSIDSVSFESGTRLTCIEERAFLSTSLISIVLPGSLESIGEYCFSYSGRLADVQVESPSQLVYIGDHAFEETKVVEVKIESGSPKPVKIEGDVGCRIAIVQYMDPPTVPEPE